MRYENYITNVHHFYALIMGGIQHNSDSPLFSIEKSSSSKLVSHEILHASVPEACRNCYHCSHERAAHKTWFIGQNTSKIWHCITLQMTHASSITLQSSWHQIGFESFAEWPALHVTVCQPTIGRQIKSVIDLLGRLPFTHRSLPDPINPSIAASVCLQFCLSNAQSFVLCSFVLHRISELVRMLVCLFWSKQQKTCTCFLLFCSEWSMIIDQAESVLVMASTTRCRDERAGHRSRPDPIKAT